MEIHEEIGVPATLEQCAEECSELAQVCLKLARKLRGENPTPAKLEHINNHLIEEIGDVFVCINEVINALNITNASIEPTIRHKKARWLDRIENHKNLNKKGE